MATLPSSRGVGSRVRARYIKVIRRPADYKEEEVASSCDAGPAGLVLS